MEIALTNADFESDEEVNLTRDKIKIFAQEIAEMVLKGKALDIKKAIHNARYLAEIDRRIANVEAGKNLITFTEEELKKFTDDNSICKQD